VPFWFAKKIITPEKVKGLAGIIVKVFLPCLIFTKVSSKLQPSELPFWWIIPLVAGGIITTGLGISWLLFWKELPRKKNMVGLSSIHNSAFLSLALLKVAFPKEYEVMALYVFLCALGVSSIIWSLGKVIITSGTSARISWRDFMTPPFLANIAALIFVMTGLRDYVPNALHESASLLGSATIPAIMLVLGASLGEITYSKWAPLLDLARVFLVKFILLPAIVVFALYMLKLNSAYPLLCIVLVIQAASPPATNLMVQVKNYGGDIQTVGSTMLFTYVACMVMIPVWFAIWQLLI
jgi:predicted permease